MTPLGREQMAARAARDLHDGAVVNLGMGMPVLVPAFLPEHVEVIFQSENGVIGMGPPATEAQADTDLVDASSRPITLAPGATIIDSAASFAMIRGGHVDVTILGAFEVAANGDLANWSTRSRDRGPLVGGAMDLAAGSRETWVIMAHNTRDGAPRLLERCALPLTGPGCVTRVYTDLAVVAIAERGFVAIEVAPGVDADVLQARTGAPIELAPDCREIRFD